MAEAGKDIYILGGPNGAGKTTAAKVLLPHWLPIDAYLNADEIARRIAPQDVESVAFQAGRIMLESMLALIRNGESFAFETTCSGKSYVKLLEACRRSGWRVSFVYLWLPSADYAVSRVARRVAAGGHRVPDAVIRRRYESGIRNMVHLYVPLADDASIYDSSDSAFRLIARREAGSPMQVFETALWNRIEAQAR